MWSVLTVSMPSIDKPNFHSKFIKNILFFNLLELQKDLLSINFITISGNDVL